MLPALLACGVFILVMGALLALDAFLSRPTPPLGPEDFR